MATTDLAPVLPPPANDAPAKPKTNAKAKAKHTFMLHEPKKGPNWMSALGRFVSTDARYAALKAASRGHVDILLRKTGTREVRRFEGARVPIEHKVVERAGRKIVYTHRPSVKTNGSFTYDGAIDDNVSVATNPVAPAA